MREAELWQRLSDQLGADYARAWAEMTVITQLHGRTVIEALDDGVAAKDIWRAVWEFLELPLRER